MPSSTVEDYVKQIYLEQVAAGEGGALVSMGRLAAAMGVVPGTATSMVKALADAGLVEYEPRGGARLTRGGERLALHVLRRHRLVELFLVRVLGLDWSEVHDEAEELEHAISDKVLDRMDRFLNHPQVDPHGDPIPSSKGKVARRELRSLTNCDLNRPLRVARVMDQNPRFLQFVDKSNLKPGTELIVRGRDESADAVDVQPRHQPALTLGASAAAKILVESI